MKIRYIVLIFCLIFLYVGYIAYGEKIFVNKVGSTRELIKQKPLLKHMFIPVDAHGNVIKMKDVRIQEYIDNSTGCSYLKLQTGTAKYTWLPKYKRNGAGESVVHCRYEWKGIK